MKTSVHSAFAALALLTGIASDAAAGSGPLEARSMLDTAVRALETDQTRALEMFNSGHPAFKQGDLYVYCADARGTLLAHGLPQLIGQDLETLRDKTGKEFGLQLLNEARQDRIGFTAYFLPKPNGTDEIYKEDYFTKIGKLTCGVGYYTTKSTWALASTKKASAASLWQC